MTKDWYRLKMMTYGVISILLVLKFFEKEEYFEECSEIKKLLLELGFETKTTEDLINDVVNHHKGIWGKEEVIEANRYYSEIIINDAIGEKIVLEIPPNFMD